MSTLNVDKVDPSTGTALEIGSSGDTITVPSGATFAVSGTMNASAITAGTIATARLGSGTASSSTVLYGDQTYKAEPGGVNTPYFEAYRSSAQSIANATETTLIFDTEIVDTAGEYDNSTGIFTPQTAGYYVLIANVPGDQWTNVRFYIKIIKDSTTIATSEQKATGGGYFPALSCSVIAYSDGSSDTFKVDVYQNAGSSQNIGGAEFINFGAFKLIA